MNKSFKKIIFSFTLILSFLNSGKILGQSNNTEALLYNIGIGSFFSGIGAVINKDPEEKIGKVFFKGMAQGALGGYLVYESKMLVGKIPKNGKLEINWAAKFVNSAGISIIENSFLNRSFWEQWNLNIGFSRIEFHVKNKLKVKYNIMPVALLLTGYSAIDNKFEFKKSLRKGVFIFSNNRLEPRFAGRAIGTAVTLNDRFLNDSQTLSHELIHVYQYHDFNFINSLFRKEIDKINNSSQFFRNIEKFIYYDIQAPFGRGVYEIENLTADSYYDNFIELIITVINNFIRP